MPQRASRIYTNQQRATLARAARATEDPSAMTAAATLSRLGKYVYRAVKDNPTLTRGPGDQGCAAAAARRHDPHPRGPEPGHRPGGGVNAEGRPAAHGTASNVSHAETTVSGPPARRRDAALRLPPLPCGCRDPESITHREGRCRYPQQRTQLEPRRSIACRAGDHEGCRISWCACDVCHPQRLAGM
jgi:hypothetical protein